MTSLPKVASWHRSVRGVEVTLFDEQIAPGAEWTIEDARHTVIVHLGGKLHGLRTELVGHGLAHREPAAGELWTIPAGSRYHGTARGGHIRYAVVQVAPQAGTLDALVLPRLAPLVGVRDAFVHACIRELVELQDGDTDDSLHSEQVLAAMIGRLSRSHSDATGDSARSAAATPPHHVRQRIERHVRENLEHGPELADLARIAGVPLHALSPWFRRAFGTTPWQYVIARRLDLARDLLTDLSCDITGIALRCGFSSHAHFTRCARQHWGAPPSRLRRAR